MIKNGFVHLYAHTDHNMKYLLKLCEDSLKERRVNFLELKTLSVIKNTIDMMKKTIKIKIDIEKIPLDDKMTFNLLNGKNFTGIFQLEEPLIGDIAKRIGITEFGDIAASLVFNLPWPISILDEYIERKHDKAPIKYIHPLLEPILKNTYGIMLYQEQMMKCANTVAGFSMTEANTLRKVLGKKKLEEVEQMRKRFVKRAGENGLSLDTAETIFETMAKSAGYGFNLSHAVSYATISYQTAYLKAHYPVQYMTVLINNETDADKKRKYIKECKRMRILIKKK